MNILIKYFCLIYSDWETLLLFYVCFYEYAFIICMNFSPCLNLNVNCWLKSLLVPCLLWPLLILFLNIYLALLIFQITDKWLIDIWQLQAIMQGLYESTD